MSRFKDIAGSENCHYQTTGRVLGEISLTRSFGDHIGKVPPVPIPNTEVKLFEPMIVPTSVKVGIAIFLKALGLPQGLFLCADGVLSTEY